VRVFSASSSVTCMPQVMLGNFIKVRLLQTALHAKREAP
jgi:hypothetical protein